jgi:hypothetical protein
VRRAPGHAAAIWGIALALVLAAVPARADVVAVLQGLDKTTARVSKFDAPLDTAVHFGTLVITARACVKRPPEEPPETAAFLEIDEVRAEAGSPGGGGSASASIESKRVFSGWMFASSPAVSAMEDPIYDINVLDCKGETDAPAPPAK